MTYYAHTAENKQNQLLSEHLNNTAKLAKGYCVPEFSDIAYCIGLIHDLGKYQNDFQKKLSGKPIKIEHSVCGAKEAMILIENKPLLKYVFSYCIAGHHSGLQDGKIGCDDEFTSSLCGCLKRNTQDYSYYINEINTNELNNLNDSTVVKFLTTDWNNNGALLFERLCFLIRYFFSCLKDADCIDTEYYVTNQKRTQIESNFYMCLERVNKKLESFVCTTSLQKARNDLQKQVFSKTNNPADIYFMNMPTGSGKTLASIKFALECAVKEKKKRIIYVIPFNSIIDQTASNFESIFQESADILRHQSTFTYEDEDTDDDSYKKHQLACENWDADLIITTAVQFFETAFSNKTSKLRRLHNLTDSIIVFDEIHTLPQKYLASCLNFIGILAKHFNTQAIFLTATMPDFRSLFENMTTEKLKMSDLVTDTSEFHKFNKHTFEYIGKTSYEKLIQNAQKYVSSLIIVNSRATAKKVFDEISTKKYHLSTYMTTEHREKVIAEIKSKLKINYQKEKEGTLTESDSFIVVSTSLIEAGIDLDFYTVFRELAGLDNVLQAAGRCNREGLRDNGNVYVFVTDEERILNEREKITKDYLLSNKNISSPEIIREYYSRILDDDDIKKANLIGNLCTGIDAIPFKTYSEHFKFMDDNSMSVVVDRDEESHELIANAAIPSRTIRRKLMKYSATVKYYEFERLIKQGVIKDYNGVYCLENNDYYDENTGIKFEGCDIII